MLIAEESSFQDYNRDIVYDLLRHVDVIFSKCLNTMPFTTWYIIPITRSVVKMN